MLFNLSCTRTPSPPLPPRNVKNPHSQAAPQVNSVGISEGSSPETLVQRLSFPPAAVPTSRALGALSCPWPQPGADGYGPANRFCTGPAQMFQALRASGLCCMFFFVFCLFQPFKKVKIILSLQVIQKQFAEPWRTARYATIKSNDANSNSQSALIIQ